MFKLKPKIIALFGVVVLSISSLVIGAVYFTSQSTNSAQAAGSVTLMPGEKALFSIEYSNTGDNTDPVSTLLSIYLGDKMELDVNSLRDQFDNGPVNCINPALVQTTGTAKFTWGYLIQYRPRSATNGLTNCNGSATAAPVDLGNFGLKKGYVTFEAKLKESNTDPAGTILNSNFTQGMKATVTYDSKQVSTEVSVVVARPTSSSSSSSSSSSAPVNKTVTPADLNTAYCLPDPVTVGQKTICYFRLVDQNAIYTLPNDTKASIATATGLSDACSLVTINAVKMVECRNVPSDSGTPGSQKIRITISNQTDDNKGNITLVQAGAQTIKNGRLYFVGMDNKQLNWDESVRYNLNYPINQKFKDGNVKLVFDQIGEDPANPANLWTTGNCTFTLSAHTLTTTYRSYQGNIVGGKCEANYPVADQTMYNYTHVVARATKPDSNKIITDTNFVVLYVGTTPVARGGPDLR